MILYWTVDPDLVLDLDFIYVRTDSPKIPRKRGVTNYCGFTFAVH